LQSAPLIKELWQWPRIEEFAGTISPTRLGLRGSGLVCPRFRVLIFDYLACLGVNCFGLLSCTCTREGLALDGFHVEPENRLALVQRRLSVLLALAAVGDDLAKDRHIEPAALGFLVNVRLVGVALGYLSLKAFDAANETFQSVGCDSAHEPAFWRELSTIIQL
jgi:hypothetical protein